MVPFSGWNMPVQYTGIIEEHIHTRSKAGLFDICHMGEFFLKGPSAAKELDRLVTCRIDNLPAGRCRYGFLLNDSGGIIDDLIVFRISPEEFMIVVNAGTVAKDRAWIEEHISPGAVFTDSSGDIAKLDVQGPLSGEIMASLLNGQIIGDLKKYYFVRVNIQGVEILLSRTGYTGERGYELFFPATEAVRVWDILSAFDDVKPVGLGARDTLRMEMGYSLYGNDIDEAHTPFEANLARFVFMEKDFVGKEALLKQQREGIDRVLAGFICEGRRSARSHFAVSVEGRNVGEVTSGAFSPCLKRGMGLCYIEKEFVTEGREITLSPREPVQRPDRRTGIKASVKSIPVYKPRENERSQNGTPGT